MAADHVVRVAVNQVIRIAAFLQTSVCVYIYIYVYMCLYVYV